MLMYRGLLPCTAALKPLDWALQVLANGNKVGTLSRNLGPAVTLDFVPPGNGEVVLDVIVEELGRDNGGTAWDLKGLMSGNITLDGESRPNPLACRTTCGRPCLTEGHCRIMGLTGKAAWMVSSVESCCLSKHRKLKCPISGNITLDGELCWTPLAWRITDGPPCVIEGLESMHVSHVRQQLMGSMAGSIILDGELHRTPPAPGITCDTSA